jgi:hypothetical protein
MIDPKVKEKILDELIKQPVIEIACKRCGVARATYYRWIIEDTEFRDKAKIALRMGKETVNDMAKSCIMKKISEGDFGAAKYWLSHNDPDFLPKNPTEGVRPVEQQTLASVILETIKRNRGKRRK